MSGRRDLGSHVADMVEACEHIILFARGISDEELLDIGRPYCGSILHHLMILGEASKQIPPEWVERYGEIPWKRIAGMRDKIVHYYFALNEETVLYTVRTSIPVVLPQLRAMLDEMDAASEGR